MLIKVRYAINPQFFCLHRVEVTHWRFSSEMRNIRQLQGEQIVSSNMFMYE